MFCSSAGQLTKYEETLYYDSHQGKKAVHSAHAHMCTSVCGCGHKYGRGYFEKPRPRGHQTDIETKHGEVERSSAKIPLQGGLQSSNGGESDDLEE